MSQSILKPLLLTILCLLVWGNRNAGQAQITVTLPTIQAEVGQVLTINVTVDDLTGDNVRGFQFDLVHDEAVFNITSGAVSGTLAAGSLATINVAREDTVKVAVIRSNPMTGSGTLIRFTGTVVAEGTSALTLANFTFNREAPEAVIVNGLVTTEEAPNERPRARDLGVTIEEDTSTNLLLSGRDPEGTRLTFAFLSTPQHGTLGGTIVVSDTSVSVLYTPEENYSGPDSFQFTVSDGAGSDTGTVTIDVTAVNDAPLAEDDAYTVEEDGVLEVTADVGVLANDTDVEDSTLTAVVEVDVEHGTLVLEADGSFTYTPDADFSGIDTFTYLASDGDASTEATVTITVEGVDDPPTASTITSPEDGETLTIGGGPGEDPVEGAEPLLEVRWTAASDPDDEEVTYEYQLSASPDFDVLLHGRTFETNDGFELTVAQVAALFDQLFPDRVPGVSATFYHRIVTSAGDLETEGPAASVTLTRGTIVGIGSSPDLPERFALQGNYPNPFNPETTLRLDLPEAAQVRVELYDVLGRRVMTVPARPLSAGRDVQLRIDASALTSGAYVYRVVAETATGTEAASGKMMLLK